MLEKSLGLLFYLKKPKDYTEGPVPRFALRDLISGEDQRQQTLMTLFKAHKLIGKGVSFGSFPARTTR